MDLYLNENEIHTIDNFFSLDMSEIYHVVEVARPHLHTIVMFKFYI